VLSTTFLFYVLCSIIPPGGGGGGPDKLVSHQRPGPGAGGERGRFSCRFDRLHSPARAATRHRAQVLPSRDTCCTVCTLFRVHPALLVTLPTGSATLTPLQPFPQFHLHNSTNVAEFPPLICHHSGKLLLSLRPPLSSDGQDIGPRCLSMGGPVLWKTCLVRQLHGIKPSLVKGW
jgi:hypothetical protein